MTVQWQLISMLLWILFVIVSQQGHQYSPKLESGFISPIPCPHCLLPSPKSSYGVLEHSLFDVANGHDTCVWPVFVRYVFRLLYQLVQLAFSERWGYLAWKMHLLATSSLCRNVVGFDCWSQQSSEMVRSWPKIRVEIDASVSQTLQFWLMSCSGCSSERHTHTHTPLTALFPGLPGWASTRKVKPILILLKQETMSGSGPYANSLHLASDR